MHKKTVTVISLLLSFLIISIALSGCTPVKRTTQHSEGSIPDYPRERDDRDKVVVFNADLSLRDYLRRISGISIYERSGETVVLVRGTNTLMGEQSALFVINGHPYGNSLREIESVLTVQDIRTIRAIKGSEASLRYGLNASAGAVIINTK